MDLTAPGAVRHQPVRPLPVQAAATAAGRDDHRPAPAPFTPTPVTSRPARRVELTFHEDLRVLITRLIDDRTGDTVAEAPARQVLDLVADVIRRLHSSEQG